jgi:hypothetical protein
MASIPVSFSSEETLGDAAQPDRAFCLSSQPCGVHHHAQPGTVGVRNCGQIEHQTANAVADHRLNLRISQT